MLQILQRVMLSNFICDKMLKKYDKSSILHTCVVIGTRQHVDFRRIFRNKTCYAFKYPRFSKYLSYDSELYFPNVPNFM